MPRLLLAWEGGAGRGHVVTLGTVAAALKAPQHIDAALCRMDHARELDGLCGHVFPGPAFQYDRSERARRGGARTATWGEFLADLGFRDPKIIRSHLDWWLEVIEARGIGLIVGDYAPLACLAARIAGIPAVGIGTGYGLPPPGLEAFPILLPRYPKRLYDEQEMVDALNEAATPLGMAPLTRLSDLYDFSDHLVRTLPLLDPYKSHRAGPYLPPVADCPTEVANTGEEVFGYFSTTEFQNAALVDALTSLNLSLRLFCPAADTAIAERLADAPHITLETRPVPVGEIARRSRMIMHSGQHGILCLGLACGLPQLAIPQHLEHEYHAQAVADRGAARLIPKDAAEPDAFSAAIRETYEADAMRQAARDLASEVRPVFAVDARRAIRARLDALMSE